MSVTGRWSMEKEKPVGKGKGLGVYRVGGEIPL